MFWVIIILVFIRLLYWVVCFSSLALYRQEEKPERSVPVSVVVCTKNNAIGLKRLLQKLLKQNHLVFEVVIVDDYSNEDIKGLVDEMNDGRLIYTKSEVNIAGKKMALTKGIEVASNEWILVTDSDCIPSSLDWISLMIGTALSRKKAIVLGYGPLRGKGFIGMIAAYEAVYVAMQYLSYALKGHAYMGVGRNMLFKKEGFLSIKPYETNLAIASGDDDMLIQKMSNNENTTICIHVNAQCISEAKENLVSYINQKVRHVGTAVVYKPFHKIILGLFGFVHIAIYGLLLFCLIGSFILFQHAVGLWLGMVSIIFIIQYACFVKLNEQGKIFQLFVVDLLLSLLYVIVGFRQLTNKNSKWN